MVKIEKEKFVFPNDYDMSTYEVFYRSCKTDTPTTPVTVDGTSEICYSSLCSRMKKEHNCVQSTIFTTTDRAPVLTLDEIHKWINLCKKHKLMPDYVSSNETAKVVNRSGKDVHELSIAINLSGIFQVQLYGYLSALRHVREDSGFVKGVLYLHEECGVDFHAAYVLSSHFNVAREVHHLIGINKSVYCSYNTPAPKEVTGSVNMLSMRCLYKILNNSSVNKGPAANATGQRWNCNRVVAKACSTKLPNMLVKISKLDDPEIPKIICEPDDNKADDLYKEFVHKK